MKEGFDSLAKQTQEAALKAQSSVPKMPTVPPMPKLPTVPTTIGGFHRRSRRKAWRTKTTRRKLEKL